MAKCKFRRFLSKICLRSQKPATPKAPGTPVIATPGEGTVAPPIIVVADPTTDRPMPLPDDDEVQNQVTQVNPAEHATDPEEHATDPEEHATDPEEHATDPEEDVPNPTGPVNIAHNTYEAQESHRKESTFLKKVDQAAPMIESAVALIGPLLDKCKAFVKIVDAIAEIHPYAKIASSVLFSGIGVIVAQYEREQAMIGLIQAMDNAYLFVIRAKDLKDIGSDRKKLLKEMSKQTIECAYFIQDQAKFRSFWRRVASNALLAGVEIDSKIKEFTLAFENIGRCFTERSVLEGEIRMVGILEDLQTTVDLQQLSFIQDAGYDPNKGCLSGTRVRTIDMLSEWVNTMNGPQVLFLLGGAGSGKSSIAHSMGALFHDLGRLGSFLRFDRSAQKDRPLNRVIRTIAHNLANWDPKFRSVLADVIHAERDLADSVNINQQWAKLIVEPLKKVTLIGPLLVVIDAFDESASERERGPLLKLLTEGAKDLPSNFRMLITSRHESDVSDVVGRCGPEYTQIKHIDLSDYENEARSDIARYLRHELAPNNSEDPLDEEDIELLANKAEGLFQWAATICRAILEKKGMTLKERLDWCLTSMLKGGTLSLDELYRGILHSLFESESATVMRRFRLVMSQILCASSPLSMESLEEMCYLATGVPGEVTLIVRAMGSLLGGVHTQGSNIRPQHTSFRDFLLDETRSQQWFVKLERGHPVMARGCLGVMTKRLALNMCGLETSYLFNHEIPDLDTRIATSISQSLSYAACNWQDHLPSTALPSDLQQALDKFLQEKLLFWFELLSLLGALNRAAPSLEAALALYQATTSGSCKELLEDAIAFIRRFAGVAALSAAHAYLSALPFSPTSSAVRSTYLERFPYLPVVQGLDDHWPQTRAVFSGHTAWVNAVAYSPDGRRVASGSSDNTVRVWDVETGATIHILKCDSWVWCVALSPDGHRIAAACRDHRVRVWDSATGDAVHVLKKGEVKCIAFSPDGNSIASASGDGNGHVCVWSTSAYSVVRQLLHGTHVQIVAFSPSGRHLASGGRDGIVRVWGADDGQMEKRLVGHTDLIHSVLFSRDGDWIISGSKDTTIRIWDFAAQQLLHTISHPDEVLSLSLSPDGRRLVSGSRHGTLLVWDLQTRQMVGNPLIGHSAAVTGVSFSPDGRHIVSGSHDKTVRIWSAEQHAKAPGSVSPKPSPSRVTSVTYSPNGRNILSGNKDGTVAVWDVNTGQFIRAHFNARTAQINSIRFSPNGSRFVTASQDGTLGVWDSETLQPLGEPLRGHESSVEGVDFSPDSCRIVSYSTDRTLRIWDAENHQSLLKLLGHYARVNCAAWSPDGTRIASGSDDYTVRLWNPETGKSVGQPFDSRDGRVLSVSWSSDSQYVLTSTSSTDGTIRFWDVWNGVPEGKPLHCRQGPLHCARYSPDGLFIVSAGKDGSIGMWNAKTRDPVGLSLANPFGSNSLLYSDLAFSPDGRHILALSGEQAIVWDVAGFTDPPHLHPSFKNLTNAMDTAAYAKYLSHGGWDGWIRDADDNKVMWVPEEYQKSIRWRGMVMTLGHSPLTIDFTDASYGPEWVKCCR